MLYKGPPRSGPTSGSCFSAAFGGSCSGTPPECDDCNKAVTCKEGSSAEGLGEVFSAGSEEMIPSSEESNGTKPAPCLYKCNDNGGCQVLYTGPPRGGATSGSCFPSSFGGSCSGTPTECQDCNQAVTCQEETNGDEMIIGTFGGKEDKEGGTKGTSEGVTVSTEMDEPCRYLCTAGGGCQVRYAGPAQDGSTVGNCFSKAFGGSCSGTPQGCRDCNKAVKCDDSELAQAGLGEGPAPGKDN